MGAPSQFPAFLSIEYDGRGDGFPAFERAANASFGQVEGRLRQFTRNFEEVGRVASKAIAGGVSNAGGLDLGVGQFKMAAAEARLYEETLREMHSAASRLAADVGDTSQATNLYIKTLSAQTIEAQRSRVEAEAQAVTYGRLQQAMDGASSAESRLSAAFRDVQKMREAAQFAKEYEQALFNIRQQVDPAYFAQKRFNQELAFADHALKSGDITADQYAKRLAFLRGEMALNAASIRQMRFASVQLGQQLQDVVIQAQMGTNAFVILAQQGSQMAFALTEAEGKVGAVARAMAGWQGAIVFAGVALVGQLIPALFNSSQRAQELSEALDKVKFASDAVQSAQGILGNVMDITTGKISTQRQELLDLAKAQLLVAQLQARARADAARGQVNDLTQSTTEYGGGMGGGLFVGRRPAGMRGQYANEFLSGRASAEETINKMKLLADNGRMTKEAFAEAAAAIANFNLETANIKSLEAAERLLNGKGTAADRKLLLKPDKPKDTSKELATLSERGEDVAKKIANITDRFSDMPPQVRSVNSAMRELDDLANDFAKKKPPNYGEIVDMLDKARVAVEEGLNKPFDDLLLTQSRELLVLDLQHKGYVDQAAALQQIFSIETARGKLTDGQKQAILDNVVAIRLMNRELDIQRQKQQAYLTAVSDVQSAIRNTIVGIRTQGIDSLKGLVSGIRNTFDNLFANVVTEKLFGDLFRDINDQITGAGRVKDAQDIEAAALAQAAAKVEAFGNAVAKAANQVAEANGATTGPVAANDNSAVIALDKINDIIVEGRYPKGPGDFLGSVLTRLFQRFLGADSPLAKDIGKLFGSAIEGAAYGQMAGGLVLGGSGSKTGAAIGGAIGNIAGKALGKVVGGPLGKLMGPLGSIAGGLLGGAIGGLFKKAKYGTVAIGANASGNLSIIGSGGNSGASIRASTKAGNAIVESIDSIAEQLGGTVDASRGSVSIGQYKGKWRVSTSGYTGKLKVKNGAVDFGKDGAEEAARFAMQDLIRDGVIVGLRAGTQQLLKNAADLEKGLAKALKFEGVFKDLRKFKDPVGAAIDDLNTEFKSLIKIFQEAGATSAETAQLEELYQIKRKAATEDAMKSLTGSLEDLYKNLTIGDNGYSLRTRLGNAQAAYDPLAARVAAGDSTAYNDFAAAAQTLIELKREFSGSTPDYFATLDQVTALTKGELDRQKALYSSAAGSASPFDTKPIVDATQQQTNAIVNALGAQNQAANDNTARILAALQSLGSRGLYMGRANF